jgi:hypothetical protein
LFVALTTTSQRAVAPTSPTRSCLHVTDSGFSPASANRCAMSSRQAALETLGTFVLPPFAPQPGSTQHNSPAAATTAVDRRIRPPDVC